MLASPSLLVEWWPLCCPGLPCVGGGCRVGGGASASHGGRHPLRRRRRPSAAGAIGQWLSLAAKGRARVPGPACCHEVMAQRGRVKNPDPPPVKCPEGHWTGAIRTSPRVKRSPAATVTSADHEGICVARAKGARTATALQCPHPLAAARGCEHYAHPPGKAIPETPDRYSQCSHSSQAASITWSLATLMP